MILRLCVQLSFAAALRDSWVDPDGGACLSPRPSFLRGDVLGGSSLEQDEELWGVCSVIALSSCAVRGDLCAEILNIPVGSCSVSLVLEWAKET